jgi:hypothetical protein
MENGFADVEGAQPLNSLRVNNLKRASFSASKLA